MDDQTFEYVWDEIDKKLYQISNPETVEISEREKEWALQQMTKWLEKYG